PLGEAADDQAGFILRHSQLAANRSTSATARTPAAIARFSGGMGSPASGAIGGCVATALPPGLAGGPLAGAPLAGAARAGSSLAGGEEPPAAVTTIWPVIWVGWTWQK